MSAAGTRRELPLTYVNPMAPAGVDTGSALP